MAQYTLVFEIDDESVRTLSAAGLRLVVAKGAGRSRPNVAWLAREPHRHTTLTWLERYGLYAAENRLGDGLRIRAVATVDPAADRAIYPFDGMEFGAPADSADIPRGHFDVRNDAQLGATFGLLQTAVLDGETATSPLNAVVVPHGFTADFSAMTTVYVWTGTASGGSIIARVPEEAAVIRFGAEHPATTYRYDAKTSTFRPAPGTQTAARQSIR